MMNCIDLDDDDDDCVMVEPSKTAETKKTKNKKNLEKKLIKEVHKHRMLYDDKHKLFRNVAKKEVVWQKIAKILNVDVDFCKNTWIELRHSYQNHARRLRKYTIHGHKEKRKRPSISYEKELVFLWRFIDNRKTCSLPFEIIEPPAELDSANKVIDDDLIFVEHTIECIVIDEDNDDDNSTNLRKFKVTIGMKTLIRQIKLYPELYDSGHASFKDYTRKSYVWNKIASDIGDKATKLMKTWTIMQTRYEWELNHLSTSTSTVSDLQNVLDFLKNYILINPDTVYKDSYYLKTAWHEPIDYFKEVYSLIVRMKKMPDLVNVTDSLLKTPEKTKEFHSLWTDIANLRCSTAGQCETTWLIMRHFYWELMNMRKHNYQLTDKWYFEASITELYDISNKLAKHKAQQQQEQKQMEEKQQQKNATEAVNRPSLGKIMPHTNEILPQMTPKIINNQTPPPTMIPGPLPKITATISLAPQALSGASLQIRPVAMPQNMPPAPQIRPVAMPQNMPPTPQILNGLPPLKASNVPASSQTKYVISVNIPQQQIVIPTVATSAIRCHAPPTPQIAQNVPSAATSAIRCHAPPTRQIAQNVPSAVTSAVRCHAPPTPQIAQNVPSAATSTIRCHAPPTPQIAQHFPSAATSTQPSLIRNIPPSITIRNIPPTPTSTPVRPLLQPTSLRDIRPTGFLKAPRFPNVTVTTTINNKVINKQEIPLTTCNMNTIFPKLLPKNNTSSASNKNHQTQTITPRSSIITPAPIAANSTPAVADVSSPDPSQAPLPKIGAAVSLLNPNEILIELIASQNGNQLVVHGPPLSEKYKLSMPTVAKLIREVLAIPLLHNKHHNQPKVINSYWEHISKVFALPPHICRACWNFLAENFNHFPQIAPMNELMAPFTTRLNVWKDPFMNVFETFDEYCISKGWHQHISRLPEVVECIGAYPVLYQNVAKKSPVMDKSVADMEIVCAWRTLSLRFPEINDLQDIWISIKNCFCQYMTDLEFGIENKLPLKWWRAFARLKFLVDAKYATVEPYYYIVSNKMMEEIDKCAMLEIKAVYNETEIPLPKLIPKIEMNELLQKSPSLEPPIPMKEVETVALLTAIQKRPIIYGKEDDITKVEAWEEVARELEMKVTDCMLAFRNATQKYCTYKKLDAASRCRLNQKYYKRFDEIFPSKPGRCKLNIKTPFELNQSIAESGETATITSADFVYPESYISDISMSNSPSNLVVKNWNFALSHLPSDDVINSKLSNILNKYVSIKNLK